MDERRKDGKYKIEQRDFIDVFLTEIDSHAHDTSEFNYYTGKIQFLKKTSGKPLIFFIEEQFLVLALDFFLAGTETTSSTMEFAFVYMILYPEVQKKVQEEIDSVVDPSNFPCTLDNKRLASIFKFKMITVFLKLKSLTECRILKLYCWRYKEWQQLSLCLAELQHKISTLESIL